MVELVDPKKEERILDPACGTAGFLISAYKHILKNDREKAAEGKGMTPDERTRLMENFEGYDISPDMVRLSLVNLYLHGFPTPKIHEYDTLTSEERWNDFADVILANPPFMSPKGGIRPHKRFSVESNRSEVLFVDYIMEHLSPNGRAAVIVPEGVIFQGGTAYKALRKKLVEEDFLVGVISLPAGVFNPYSGVKTSILWIDRQLAKKAKEIVFCKIAGDGFELGAQRKLNGKNDIPKAIEGLLSYRTHLNESREFHYKEFQNITIVKKQELSKDANFNLTYDRYEIKKPRFGHHVEVKLGEVILEIKDGGTPSRNREKDYFGGDINWCVVKDIRPEILTTKEKLTELGLKNCSAKVWPVDSIIISLGATIGQVGIAKVPTATKQGLSGIIVDRTKILPKFLYTILISQKDRIQSFASGVTIKEVRPSALKELLSFPLPPIEEQEEIVAEIEGYQKIIDGARMVVENYRPRIEVDPSWPVVKLGEVCEFKTGGTPTSTKKEYYDNGTIKWLVSGDIHQGEIFDCPGRITQLGLDNSNAKYLPENSVLIALNGQGKTRGTVALLRTKATCNQSLVSISPKDTTSLLPEFIYFSLRQKYQEIRNITGDNQRSGLNIPILKSITIQIPDVDEQRKIIRQLDSENLMVKNAKQLIEIFEEKIRLRVAKVWGE